MKSKNLIILVSLLLSLLFLASCNVQGNSGSTSDVTTGQSTQDGGVTEEVFTNIIENSTTQYKIVRPDLTSVELQDITVRLRNEINGHYGTSVQIETDFEGRNFNVENRYKYEIVVGATNRSESVAAVDSLRYNDFLITMSGTRVVITGGCDTATVSAVEYFIENYIKGDVLTVSTGIDRVNSEYLRSDTVKLGGIDLSKYTIVYGSDMKESAQTASVKLGLKTGAVVDVQTENKADVEYGIYLNSHQNSAEFSAGLGVDDFKIVTKGSDVHIVGGSGWAADTAIERFIDFVSEGADSSEISLESCNLSYTLPNRDEYINDITKLALHWELNFDVPEWMLDFNEKYKALNDGDGRLMSCLHRGEMVYYPENSIEGVISSIMMGADMIEIDPRKTKDGVLILMHDDTLDRTTNVNDLRGKNGLPDSTLVSEWTYEQIMQLNLKESTGGSDAKVTPYKVPTLEEVIKVCANRIFIRLDVKSDENGVVFWKYERDIWPLQEKYKTYYNVIYTWHSAFTSSSYKIVKNYNKTQKELTGKIAPFFIGYKALSSATPASTLATISTIGSTKTVRLTDFDLKTKSAEEYIEGAKSNLAALKNANVRIYVDAHRNESIELYETLYEAGIDIQLTNKGLVLCKYIAKNFSATK